MLLYSLILGIVATFRLSSCHPTAEPIKLPKVEVTSPQEINNLGIRESAKTTRSVDSELAPANNIETTVKEVEDLLKADPKLPRLTRGEILDILENITVADQIQLNKSREDGKRALMLVMPFTPEKLDDGVVDLYTKPPITKIVGGEPFKSKDVKSHREKKPIVTSKVSISESTSQEALPLLNLFPDIKINDTVVTEKPKEVNKIEVNNDTKPVEVRRKTGHRRRRPALTSPTTSTTTKTTTTKLSTTTDEDHINTNSSVIKAATPVPITTYKPKTTLKQRKPARRRTTIPPTTKYPNHKYPEEDLNSDIGLTVVNAPNLSLNNEEIKSDEEVAAPVTFQKPVVNSEKVKTADDHTSPVFYKKPPAVNLEKVKIEEEHTSPVFYKKPHFESDTSSPPRRKKPYSKKPIIEEINMPDDLKSIVEDLNLDEAVKLAPTKFSSQYAVTNPKYPNRGNVKDILASLGTFTTTTTTPLPDVSNVADNLSPDMRELLMSFGLIPDPNKKSNKNNMTVDGGDRQYPEHANISPDSYVNFKPLPDSAPTRDDMEAFFASFGLGRSARKQKALKQEGESKKESKGENEAHKFSFDMVPEQYKALLGEMGLAEREDRKIRTNELNKTVEKQHVFSPVDSQYTSQEELGKLNKLLDMIKQLEKLNGTATDDDLKNIDMDSLKELVGSLNNEEIVPLNEQYAPNPLNYEYGIEKNEVKRQENATGSTTTEEPKTPSLKDLEDSFGGSTDTTSESPPPETTTASKRTGFYYLVDWNTFLDIDNQKGKRVNLRFQPTIGDPKRFLSVSVP